MRSKASGTLVSSSSRFRGCSSVGRASPWHGEGQGFDSPQLHKEIPGHRRKVSPDSWHRSDSGQRRRLNVTVVGVTVVGPFALKNWPAAAKSNRRRAGFAPGPYDPYRMVQMLVTSTVSAFAVAESLAWCVRRLRAGVRPAPGWRTCRARGNARRRRVGVLRIVPASQDRSSAR